MKRGYSRPLDFYERKQIEKFIKQGLSCGQVALKINRSKNGVATEVRRGGGRDYNAKNAQRISDEIKMNKYKKLSERNKGTKVAFYMKRRIENLEMQVEILHDCVKELMNK